MKKYLLGVFILISSLQIWAQTTAPKEEWNYKYDQYFSYAGSGRGYALDNFSKGKNKLVGVGMTFYSANDSEARLQGLIFFNDKGQESTSALLNCSIRGSVATRPTCGASVVSYKVIPTDDEGFLLISPDSVRKYTSTNQLQWKTAVANKSQKAVSAGSGIYYVLGTDAVYQLKESGQIVVTKKITVASISTVSDIAPTNSGEFTVTGTLGTYRYNKDGKILNSNLASQGNSIIATNNDFFYVVSGNTVLKLSGSLVQVGKYDIIGIKVTTLAADQTLALIASNTLVKLKSDLSVQWSAVGNFMDVTVTTDGGVAATNSGTITKYSMEGKVKWSKTYTDASGINVFPASDGGLFYRKVTSQNNSDLNKLAPDCSLTALITAPSSTAICTGTSLKLTAKLTSTASTAYSYQWKKDSVNVGTNSAEFTASQAGKYSVVVTQGTCAATSNELTITLTALPTLTAITGNRDEICEGTTITLATKASGGSGSVYTYQWKRNEVDSSGANLASLAVKTSGTYSVTAKDTNGCVSKPQSTVVTIIKPMLYITPAYTSNQRNWLCSADKDSVRLQIYAGPNFKAETYSWTRNGTEISKSSAPIYVKDAAEYTLEISNSNGCKAKSPLVKTEIFPSPKAYAGPNATLTGSEVYDLKKLNVITASGGTPGYTYYWAALPGSQSYSEANPTFAPFTTNTKVILTLVDSKNCVSSDTAYVQVNSCKIRTSIRAANNLTYVCSGNTLTLLGSVLDTLGAVKYSWREGNTVVGTGKNVSISKAGSYYLSVEDSKGCMSTSNIQVITLKDSPKPVITGDTSYCKGGGALLTAVVTGGQPSYRYKWELGTVPVTDGTSRQYNASAPGSYYVTVTDTLGCYTRSTVKVITEKGADLVSNITPATSLQVMEPDSVILNAPSGLNYNYLWRKDNANVTGANGARLVLKGSRSSGSYVVIVSRDGCSVPSQSVMVRIEAPTAVEPTSPQIAVLVAPNPARNRAVVSVTLPQASSAQIQLYNLMGQPLVSQGSSDVSKNHRFELDLSSLSSGLFIWKVQAGNQSRQGRLIKNDE